MPNIDLTYVYRLENWPFLILLPYTATLYGDNCAYNVVPRVTRVKTELVVCVTYKQKNILFIDVDKVMGFWGRQFLFFFFKFYYYDERIK